MAPFELTQELGRTAHYIIILLIGMGFGSALEMSGFGDSRKMAAQFYLKELTVLKVMFTAIITAMSLIFFFSAFGWLDYDYVWVNTTFLWPGIIGGLIMGIGFVIGGFCPGTSLVSLASFKVDGMFFVLGNLLGIFVFGETIDKFFTKFWLSSRMGRFTLQDWLGVDAGVVVAVVVIAALGMFVGAEKIEEIASGSKRPLKNNKTLKITAVFIGLLALITLFKGQPSLDYKWELIPDEQKNRLANREIFAEPIEVLHVMKERNAKPILLDLRPEPKFNEFHIIDSKNISPSEFNKIQLAQKLKKFKNAVIFLISDREKTAVKGWKKLTSQKLNNVYILNGGIQNWTSYFSKEADHAHQEKHVSDPEFHHYKNVKFVPKVKQAKARSKSGGCG